MLSFIEKICLWSQLLQYYWTLGNCMLVQNCWNKMKQFVFSCATWVPYLLKAISEIHSWTRWKLQALPNLRLYMKTSIVYFMLYCISGLFNAIVKPTTSSFMERSVAEETGPELTNNKHKLLVWLGQSGDLPLRWLLL